ncbi:hypothetical protein [Clostridium botulinum]|uniref:hypothetical protein n=1 Tax=Clostridium botulinum TaxID=1491 RepID=UPI000AD9B7AA|nr:hypothetical protein [Clostridium botulinum]MBY6930899.1 hypothetical protein [Clostridium botulinum]NFG21128.1 hypothetical protein [Clostridium botulinum]NFO80004.1 hypothetical protein [Clostridium botulinum]
MNKNVEEILVGITKGAISAVPCVGGALNEFLFEIRGRIAQDRINNFVDSFIQYINEVGTPVDEEALTSENFNDMYVSITRHVIECKSQYKIDIFKRILESNLRINYESDFRDTFLELVNKLDCMEFEILKMFKDTGRRGSMDIPEGTNGCVSTTESISCKDTIINRIKESNAEISNLEAVEKYEFYICDLISKSLLVDSKTIGNT